MSNETLGVGQLICNSITPPPDRGFFKVDDTTTGHVGALKVFDPVTNQPSTVITATPSALGNEFPPTLRSNVMVEQVPPPASAFESLFPVAVQRDRNGEYRAIFNPLSWKNADQTVIYCSISRGNDTTGTGAYATPYKGIKKALTMAAAAATDNVTIYVEPGFYDRTYGWQGTVCAKNVNLIALGHVVSSVSYEPLVWSADTTAGVYLATRSAVAGVFDKANPTNLGIYSRLAIAASLADCRATKGTYYTDGTTLYVHRVDEVSPTAANTLVTAQTTGAVVSNSVRYYIEGVIFEGAGTNGAFYNNYAAGQTAGEIIFNRCTFRYAFSNGLSSTGSRLCISYQCSAYGNDYDGFNHHVGSANGVFPTVVEIECSSFANGNLSDTAYNDNGFTVHESCTALRVACRAAYNVGPQFADIDASKVWNLGCIAGQSLAADGPQKSGFQALHTCTMYLDGCVDEGINSYSFYANTPTGVVAATKRSVLPNTYGAISAY